MAVPLARSPGSACGVMQEAALYSEYIFSIPKTRIPSTAFDSGYIFCTQQIYSEYILQSKPYTRSTVLYSNNYTRSRFVVFLKCPRRLYSTNGTRSACVCLARVLPPEWRCSFATVSCNPCADQAPNQVAPVPFNQVSPFSFNHAFGICSQRVFRASGARMSPFEGHRSRLARRPYRPN